MAENHGQGEHCGTASKNKGRHQEALERPTGEGALANLSGEEVPRLPSPPTEDAPSDDSNSELLDLDTLSGPSGTTGQSDNASHTQSITERPPSVSNTTATKRPQTSVPRTHRSAVCPPVQGPQFTPHSQGNQGPGVRGHTVQGTQAQGARDGRRTAVRQEEDRPREPTVQEALANVLEAYQQSQDKMGQILNIMQENQWLQEVHHQEIRKDLQALNTTMVSIAGVLADMANIMRDYTTHQRSPSISQSTEQPSTYSAASGQEALPEDPQATNTPPPAEGEPPRKRSLRPRQKPETFAKTPSGNETLLNVPLKGRTGLAKPKGQRTGTVEAPPSPGGKDTSQMAKAKGARHKRGHMDPPPPTKRAKVTPPPPKKAKVSTPQPKKANVPIPPPKKDKGSPPPAEGKEPSPPAEAAKETPPPAEGKEPSPPAEVAKEPRRHLHQQRARSPLLQQRACRPLSRD
ncbi:hypothetical protein NDU88_002393 [Pleurodeles waltl]|uniref:Uncharacterized protein n=1 Tax=Pleurodeles waltl TaxID=8319 RepID=A0AAV7NHL0_PLEWA|nr:hypothetical protein NDU88_002393 [Pleurodeles waltl]